MVMSYDESNALSEFIEDGWLFVDSTNYVICWADGKTYRAKITFEEIEDE